MTWSKVLCARPRREAGVVPPGRLGGLFSTLGGDAGAGAAAGGATVGGTAGAGGPGRREFLGDGGFGVWTSASRKRLTSSMKLRADDGRWLLEATAMVRAAGVIVTSGAGRDVGGCEGGGMAACSATSLAFCSAFSAAAASASACFWFLSRRASAARSRFSRASRSLRSFSASASVSASSSSSRVRFRADFLGDLLERLASGSSPYSLPSSPLVPW